MVLFLYPPLLDFTLKNTYFGPLFLCILQVFFYCGLSSSFIARCRISESVALHAVCATHVARETKRAIKDRVQPAHKKCGPKYDFSVKNPIFGRPILSHGRAQALNCRSLSAQLESGHAQERIGARIWTKCQKRASESSNIGASSAANIELALSFSDIWVAENSFFVSSLGYIIRPSNWLPS